MKTVLLSALCLALLVPLAGCRGPQEVRDDRYDADKYPRIVGFKGLVGDLAVGPYTVVPGPNPPMRVSVPLRLLRNDPQNVQYRFLFLDLTGTPTQDESGWQFVVMQPRVQTQVTGIALSPRATDWRLELREAREGVEFR